MRLTFTCIFHAGFAQWRRNGGVRPVTFVPPSASSHQQNSTSSIRGRICKYPMRENPHLHAYIVRLFMESFLQTKLTPSCLVKHTPPLLPTERKVGKEHARRAIPLTSNQRALRRKVVVGRASRFASLIRIALIIRKLEIVLVYYCLAMVAVRSYSWP